jgi:8-oxo-dGTP diphosphatase
MQPTGTPRKTQRTAVYGLLLDEGRVVLARSSGLSALPGRWWLPGGGIDFGETPTECVVREFQEETGLVVEPAALLDVLSEVTDLPERNEQVHTVRVLYDVRLVDGSLLCEADGTTDAVAWHSVPDALSLPLMPFVRAVLNDV